MEPRELREELGTSEEKKPGRVTSIFFLLIVLDEEPVLLLGFAKEGAKEDKEEDGPLGRRKRDDKLIGLQKPLGEVYT